jgi:ribosome biogenesis GTPase A
VLSALPEWPWKKSSATANSEDNDHLSLARESLRQLIGDQRLPPGVRDSLAQDYALVKAMLDKLEHGHIHLAVFGRVSTGKSSLLNALIGEQAFTVSPLHGETRASAMQPWNEVEAGGVYLIDTPGLDEAGGEDREKLALEVLVRHADDRRLLHRGMPQDHAFNLDGRHVLAATDDHVPVVRDFLSVHAGDAELF